MSKDNRPKARVAKGFRDIGAGEIRGVRRMLATIQQVYESYGFEPVEQPFVNTPRRWASSCPTRTAQLRRLLLQDDDDQWLSLRYDLTAPLARYVAENQKKLPRPIAATARAGSSATRSRDRAASASSCSSTPTRWAPPRPPPTPKSA